ncbi:MAG: RpoH suppressor [Alphaproteobacteria bacterium]|nr:MAG: RpoH suppressor [Alphaproteobacteria bacterium]
MPQEAATGQQTGLLECDVIMKGGITSGVVYPQAILTLAQKYRFRSIGGTSAGAIAAAVTAAAEHGRKAGGFSTLEAMPGELQTDLLALFQPTRKAAPWFGIVTAALGKKWLSILWGIIRLGLPWGPLAFLVAMAPLVLVAGPKGWLVWSAGVLVSLVFLFGVSAFVGIRRLMRLLAQQDYGLCPGSCPDGERGAIAPLSDWLSDRIDRAAGIEGREIPLLFRDLKTPGADGKPVSLKTVTTNLSMRRPHTLPDLGDRNYYFDPTEFRRLLPKRVVDYMQQTGDARLAETEARLGDKFIWPTYEGRRLSRFPEPDDLPVIVAARMSLSFPFLISAVPLYRVDYPARVSDDQPAPMRRLLFSDGGLSSNFPIHFFDSLLPMRPTFGICLDEWDPLDPKRRVRLPMQAGSGQWQGIGAVRGTAAFAMSLMDAAKDWQDQLQSRLAGYRERIVHVYLKPDEGGMNLTMPAELIKGLGDLGGRAGELMAGTSAGGDDSANFDFTDHQWRRVLVLYAALEEALGGAAKAWPHVRPGIEALLKTPPSYGSSTLADRKAVLARLDGLLSYVDATWTSELRDKPALIPKPSCALRISPDY